MEDNRLSYLENFNQGVEDVISLAEKDINALAVFGENVVEEIDGVILEKSPKLIHDIFGYYNIEDSVEVENEDFVNRFKNFLSGEQASSNTGIVLYVKNVALLIAQGAEEATKDVAVYTTKATTLQPKRR